MSLVKLTWLPFLFLRTICISFSVNYVFIITWLFSFSSSFFKIFVIYLITLGHSCGTWDLCCLVQDLSLWQVSSRHVGLFSDWGLNPWPQHCKAKSYPFSYQGSPALGLLIFFLSFVRALYISKNQILAMNAYIFKDWFFFFFCKSLTNFYHAEFNFN